MFLGLTNAPGRPNQPFHQEFSGFTEIALFAFLFGFANFILLFAALRVPHGSREEVGISFTEWAFGFFLPLLLLFVLRARAAASL